MRRATLATLYDQAVESQAWLAEDHQDGRPSQSNRALVGQDLPVGGPAGHERTTNCRLCEEQVEEDVLLVLRVGTVAKAVQRGVGVIESAEGLLILLLCVVQTAVGHSEHGRSVQIFDAGEIRRKHQVLSCFLEPLCADQIQSGVPFEVRQDADRVPSAVQQM